VAHQVLSAIQTCMQLFIIIFQQYNFIEWPSPGPFHEQKDGNNKAFYIYFWTALEVNTFYLYLFSAALYLFIMSIRGMFFDLPDYEVKHRWRHDAINFYLDDIQWFSFSFVIACLSVIIAISLRLAIDQIKNITDPDPSVKAHAADL